MNTTYIYGDFSVTEIMVKRNTLNHTEYDYLEYYIKSNNLPEETKWYAKKLNKGIYHFKFTNNPNILQYKKYLEAYQDTGWTIAQ